jgi:hypothetical protein
MRHLGLIFSTLALAACGGPDQPAVNQEVPVAPRQGNQVTVDYDMTDAGLRWLELVAAGADTESLHEAFMRDVAPTAGCQTIIRHWARFRDWDEEIFYRFILGALGLGDEGDPTSAHAKRLWEKALRNPDQIRKNLESLRSANIREAALEKARRYLPPEADVSNRFHVVLFGGSSAFSVGDDNGFDLLQLETHSDGTIDVQRVIDVFAHEIHHSGYMSVMEKRLGATAEDERIFLPGVLVAEGLATYFTTPPFPHLEAWRESEDPAKRELAADWDGHYANMPQLYVQAARDIDLGLNGDELMTDELVSRWLGGMQGPAYGLGVDMIRTIEAELGPEAAVNLAHDPRRLLTVYNEAARKAREGGRDAYPFDEGLAARLESFDPGLLQEVGS